MEGHFWAYALVAVAVMSGQALLIGALLAQRARLRRTEVELRHLEARNAAMLDSIPDLMFLIGTDGVYLDYHAKDPNQLYVPPERFVGKRIVDIMPPDLATIFMREIGRVKHAAEPRVIEYALPMHGEIRHYETRLVPCDGDSILSMVRDITSRKRAQAELQDRETELQRTNARNHDLAGRLIAAQEAERRRVARELHDDLSQKLALLSIDADQLRLRSEQARGSNRELRSDGLTIWDSTTALVREISNRAHEIASDIHRLSHELHPAKLAAIGLVASLEALCRDASIQHHIAVDFLSADVPLGVGVEVSLCLYRVTQEALHNITKHSGATCALVRIAREADDLTLQIADQGHGFLLRDADGRGLGLLSMRERVSFLGGEIDIHSAPGQGTRIGVRVPLHVGVSQAAGSA